MATVDNSILDIQNKGDSYVLGKVNSFKNGTPRIFLNPDFGETCSYSLKHGPQPDQ